MMSSRPHRHLHQRTAHYNSSFLTLFQLSICNAQPLIDLWWRYCSMTCHHCTIDESWDHQYCFSLLRAHIQLSRLGTNEWMNAAMPVRKKWQARRPVAVTTTRRHAQKKKKISPDTWRWQSKTKSKKKRKVRDRNNLTYLPPPVLTEWSGYATMSEIIRLALVVAPPWPLAMALVLPLAPMSLSVSLSFFACASASTGSALAISPSL